MREYLKIWLILFVGLVAMTLMSFAGGLDIGPISMKASALADILTKPVASDAPANTTENSLHECADSVAADSTVVAQPDTAAHTILIFGDSMLEGLNSRLGAYAKANGHKLYSVIWYSSTTKVWGENIDTLRMHMRQFKPDYVFVSLGANELFVRDIISQRGKYVDAIIAELGQIPYIWIGPPNWKKDTGINELLQKKLPKGTFFLSDGMHFDRAKDGAHPTRKSAAFWMDSVARWMALHAAHPIRLEKPDSGVTGRPLKVIIHKPLQ